MGTVIKNFWFGTFDMSGIETVEVGAGIEVYDQHVTIVLGSTDDAAVRAAYNDVLAKAAATTDAVAWAADVADIIEGLLGAGVAAKFAAWPAVAHEGQHRDAARRQARGWTL